MANKPEFEEYSVLVGDFPSIDDSKCQKMLEQIKHLSIDPSMFVEEAADEKNIKEWREAIKKIKKGAQKGPLGSAFTTPNPLLPEDYLAQQTVDTTILEINRGIEHSLLDCPGQYSVRVATFRGSITMNIEEIEKEQSKFKQLLSKGISLDIAQSKLAQSDLKARKLCDELRKLGVEAYVFHDRSESYVCVGSYDWISRTNSLSEIEFNPEVEKTILLYKGNIESLPGNQQSFAAKTLPGLEKHRIAFDVQPIPVIVPKYRKTETARQGLFGVHQR
jgi:hypothetical protein